MTDGDLVEYYKKRGLPEDAAGRAGQFFRDYLDYLRSDGVSFEEADVGTMKTYIDGLINTGDNTDERLLALARAAYLAGQDEVYVYFTQVIERDTIIANLADHVATVAGREIKEDIFADLPVPPAGSPPDQVLDFTRCLVTSLRARLGEDDARRALTANAHGIPETAFAQEKERFRELGDIDVYLTDYHNRMVETLEAHAQSGKLWFEQVITDRVVSFVREHPEVLGGVRVGNTIYQTKIPYDPDRWLTSNDEAERRYLACHCPMARESIEAGKSDIPALWCACSAGFAKLRYDAIFETATEARTVASVLAGDDLCRFAIEIP